MVSLPKSMKTTPTCGRQPRTTTSSNEPQEKRPARNRTINNRNGQTLEAIDKRLTEFQILYSQIGKVRPLQVGNSQTLSMNVMNTRSHTPRQSTLFHSAWTQK
uniref:Uncharacterized protein n=1 Tax=Cacopsylla melanoneura TaxID=428564 RepID=A0A8D8Y8A0_9HEMI